MFFFNFEVFNSIKNLKMTKKFYLFYFLIFIFNLSFSQDEKSKFINTSKKFEFKDGLYFNFESLKNNKPFPKNKITTSINYSSLDFFKQLMKQNYIIIFDSKGVERKISKKKIWGYCQKGNIYINWNGEFNRIGIIGLLSHFVANLTRSQTRPANPYSYNSNFSMRNGTYKTTEMRQYILDFSNGKIMEYNRRNLEKLLKKDKEIYEEYINLSKRKRRKLKFKYLKKFNEKHQIF